MRCPACPGVNKCVGPSGPENSPYIFIGEAPGADESKKGEPFVGKTGREVNEHYLPLAGLRRCDVRFDNAISCLPVSTGGRLDLKRSADRELLHSCADHHLYPALQRNHYTLIVPMGAFACYALDPDIDLELQHGFPLETKWGTVFPMYHPAGGIHEPKKMLHIRTDWSRLRKYLNNKLYLPKDEYAGREEYGVVESTGHLESILDGYSGEPMACDTESTRRRDPFCLTLSVQPGTGYLIPAESLHILEAFQAAVDSWRGVILWHNWLYDGSVVKRMGLTFPRKLIRDTMAMAFHLGNIPQGLKALAWRELGMTMKDFNDLVVPHSTPRVIDYYRQAYALDWDKPEAQLNRVEGGKWKVYQPQSMHTKLKRFFSDYTKNPDKDPFKMWTDNWQEQQSEIQEKCGPYPGKCITHAWEDDKEEVIRYACRDSDSLLRLYPIIRWMDSQVRHRPQEFWRDVA